MPFYAERVGPVVTNATFFIGAIFFTLAALIQLALSGRRPPRRGSRRADRADWWAAAVQFAGTLFFNLSTITALITAIIVDLPGKGGWRPDAWGSICFLVASAFAVVATTDREGLWDPHASTWRCTWLNMAGSVFFGVSAIGAYVDPETGTSSVSSGRTSERSSVRSASSWRHCSAAATSRRTSRRPAVS